MSGRVWTVVIALVGAAGWLLVSIFFTVDETQQALVLRFGRPVATIVKPGLHMEAPLIDTVLYYDNRIEQLEPGSEQIILGDEKRIVLTTYTQFRIADVLRFYRSVRSVDQARVWLSQIVSSAMRRELGKVKLASLLSADRDAVTLRVQTEVAETAKPLGIDVVTVRIRRADLPSGTSQAICDRMVSERQREAKELRAQGFEWAQQIKAAADRERTAMLAEAERQSTITRGEGEAEADRVAAEAYDRDADFFRLYRMLQAYRESLAQPNATVLLSPGSDFLRLFDVGPAGSTAPGK
ncbi:MAG TPA: protease modulator HflC [Acetobacteraceae bacterium]|nr:protease modulator HflC [Acetobacteraceae bacterium]